MWARLEMARRRKAAGRTTASAPQATKMQVGSELGPDGHRIGRDPRQMKREELRAMGHVPTPVLAAIRSYCIDCSGGSPSEAAKCMVLSCPLWPFRTKANPWRQPASSAQREHGRTLRAKRRRNSSEAQSLNAPNAESAPPVPE